MAKRRMFLTEILESDLFLELPAGAQMLYVHLCMHADDEGFLGGSKSVLRMTGAEEADLTALEKAGFVLRFASGVCVVRHWREHNLIRPDRFTPTRFTAERAQIYYAENEGYCMLSAAEPSAPASADVCPAAAGGTADFCPANAGTGKDSSGKYSSVQFRAVEEKERKKENGADNAAFPAASAAVEREKDFADKEALPADRSKPVAVLPLADGGTLPLQNADIRHYQTLYPAVDVRCQLLKMQGWCEANPDKRRPATEIRRFIAAWLSREADKSPPPEKTVRAPTPPSYDMALAEQTLRTTVPALKKRAGR